MKDRLYKMLPVILTVTGFIIIICLFHMHDYFYVRGKWGFWLIMSFINVFFGITIGTALKRFHNRAGEDPLTGLPNRWCFCDNMNYELKKMKCTRLPLSFALIDIDNFKVINDTYGHLKGDRVLIELAGLLKRHIRSGDTIVRWGGEEFAMILPATDENGAVAFTERIRMLIESASITYPITVCIGVTTVYRESDAEKIISAADRALYKAKENKNSVVFLKEEKTLKAGTFRGKPDTGGG